ncbi:ATP-binding protein [Kitasatospora sp. NPDC051853]|uniref:ATP-binding protein n=1 Tax=Kitasatospora sp. NPDC051853 TaxID=3364058 RepID=UPI00379FDC71
MTGEVAVLEPKAALAEVSAELPYEPGSAVRARHLVRATLTGWGLDSLVDDALLVISELVSNAVKTGCRLEMTVRIIRLTAVSVRVSVTDGCRVLPVRIEADDSEESGRGVDLVHQLTEGRWGAAVESFGKTVHADLRVGRKP